MWACRAVLLPNGEVWLGGVDRPVTPAIWRAVRDELVRLGVSAAVWERRADGKHRRFVQVKV